MASDVRLKEQLPRLTERIIAGYKSAGSIHYLGHCPLPNYDEIIAATSIVYRAPLVTRDTTLLASTTVPLARR